MRRDGAGHCARDWRVRWRRRREPHQPQPFGREQHVGLGDRQHHDHGRGAIVQSQPRLDGDGGTVAWANRDSAVHRIVANDGSFDTGDISPGATSRAITVSGSGANYHCSIHPAMIGAIGAAQGQPPPPCTGQYCD